VLEPLEIGTINEQYGVFLSVHAFKLSNTIFWNLRKVKVLELAILQIVAYVPASTLVTTYEM
jgi:hypothetical protein